MLWQCLMFICLILSINSCVTSNLKWNEVDGPTRTESQVYGGYSAGCLDGAEAIKMSSPNHQVMRVARNRLYGHPSLIQFIDSYSKSIFDNNLGILAIGDLSQPRGGPMVKGHASHQIGLDVDIWFKRFTQLERNSLSANDLESYSATSMINKDSLTLNKNAWSEANTTALKLASEDDKVERIFVNFVIKKYLCDKHKSESWMNKLRPWWGHKYHYHVRLSCPENNSACKSQPTPENNDGCDETLAWWFSEEAQKEYEKKRNSKKHKIRLPLQCDKVFIG